MPKQGGKKNSQWKTVNGNLVKLKSKRAPKNKSEQISNYDENSKNQQEIKNNMVNYVRKQRNFATSSTSTTIHNGKCISILKFSKKILSLFRMFMKKRILKMYNL